MWHAERDDPGSAAHWIDVSIRITGPTRCDGHRAWCPERRCAERTVAHHLPALQRPVEADVVAGDHRVVRARGADPGGPFPTPTPRLTHGVARPRQPAAISGRRDAGCRGPSRSSAARASHPRRRVFDAAAAWRDRRTRRELAGTSTTFPCWMVELQYADYAVWERSWLTGEALTTARRPLPPSVRSRGSAARPTHRPPAYRSAGATRAPVRLRVSACGCSRGAGAGRARAGFAVLGAARGASRRLWARTRTSARWSSPHR